MNRRLIFIVVIVFATSLIGYGQTLDPKWREAQKIDSLCQWSWQTRRVDNALSKKYAAEAIKLSTDLGDLHRLGNSYFYSGSAHLNAGEPVKAFEFYSKSAELLVHTSDKVMLARVYNGMGLSRADLGLFEDAIEYYEKTLLIYRSTNDKEGIALQYQNIGVILYQLGRLEEAFKNYMAALSILEKMTDADPRLIANNYQNTAILYNNLNEFEKSLNYYRKAISLYNKTNDLTGIAEVYANMGVLYFDSDIDSSYYYHNKALQLFKQTGNRQREGNSYSYVADIMREKNINDSALLYYNLAKEILEECEFPYGIVSTLTGRGILYRNLGLNSKSYEDFKKAYDICLEIESMTMELVVLSELVITLENLKDYKNAYESLSRLILVKDSLMNQEKISLIKNIEYTYEAEKKTAEIDRLTSEKQLISQRLFLLASLFSLLIILLFVFINRQRLLRKKDKELALTKLENAEKEIELRKKLLLNYTLRISEKNSFLSEIRDKLRKSDIKSGKEISSIISNINTNLLVAGEREEINKLTEQAGVDFFKKINVFSKEITEAEKKVCVFLSLGMVSKDIASIMNISHKTVDNYRSSIRKKLNITTNESLTEFLRDI